jgi:hypothetical protein
MKKDFSNQRMTQNYMDLYKTLLWKQGVSKYGNISTNISWG